MIRSEQITKVFMDLNYDSGFKEEFAGRFFYYYPAFIAYSYLPAKVNAVHVVLSTVSTSPARPQRACDTTQSKVHLSIEFHWLTTMQPPRC